MGRGNMSKELLDKLTEFLCSDIGGKVLDGITYVMTLKCEKDSNLTNKYSKIREEADKCGYSRNEAFRIYEVNNGYIFDMDLSVARYITKLVSKKVLSNTKDAQIPDDLINNKPDKRREEDMVRLAKKCLKEFKSGETKMEVALFSRNSTPKITITATAKDNSNVVLQYDAFAIRHWDIEQINDKYLIPRGMRIRMLEACDIFTSRTGVRYVLHFEKVGRR